MLEGEQQAEAISQAVHYIRETYYQNKLAMTPLSQTQGLANVDTGWKIQLALIKQLEPSMGPLAGWKVAYSNKEVQAQWGIDEPIAGAFFKSQLIESGATLDESDYNKMMLEAELVFTLAEDIDEKVDSLDQLRDKVALVSLGMDLPNNNFSFNPIPADVVAAAAGSKYYIVGAGQDPSLFDLENLNISLRRDEKLVYEGMGKNTLGGPWHSLQWLANKLVDLGKPLKKGQLVFCGAVAIPVHTQIAGHYLAEAGPLGALEVTVKPADKLPAGE